MKVFDSIIFAQGTGNAKPDKFVHGGKGAGLITMCNAGLNVPPGIIIPVSACKAFEKLTDASDKALFLDAIMKDVEPNLNWLAAVNGGHLPLLSVRSGAPVSMPGMMDTILNVGAFDVAHGLEARHFYDCQRRLVQMLGTTAYGVDSSIFEYQKSLVVKDFGCKTEYDLDDLGMKRLASQFVWAFEQTCGDFPKDVNTQLRMAIKAVFESWNSERAIEYRKLNKIPATYGTAVVIQTMVFGNADDQSGTGVLFSRNPSTGEGGMFGEFLINAQGEDVVAGTATPVKVATMKDVGGCWPKVYEELVQTCFKLESLESDMVDIEFTVQEGELFILQFRKGKRSALAAFVIAHDMVEGGLISKKEAFKRITRDQVITIRLPSIDPAFNVEPNFVGLPACPGVVSGKAVHTSSQAVEAGERVILVREETSPDDIAGMSAAAGILTRTGGATSHAAVVARAMDKPCVVGCTDLVPNDVDGLVTIDGSTGRVWIGVEVPVIEATDSEIVKTVMQWAVEDLKVPVLNDTVQIDGEYTIGIGMKWNDKEALSELLDELEAQDVSKVTLDCSQLDDLELLADQDYAACFGHLPSVADVYLVTHFADMLRKKRKKLAGLTLQNFPIQFHIEGLRLLGFKIADDNVSKAVPAEYALFKAIKNAIGE